MSPARSKADALAHYTALRDAACADYNAELVAKVEADAAEATRLPWWFPEAAVAVFIVTLALSAAFPWGVA